MANGHAPWLATGTDKRESVRALFADVAPSYDLINSLMCFRLHHRWRRYAVKSIGIGGGDSVLDVCCGTGDFLTQIRAAVGRQGTVIGLDFCPPMLTKAVEKGVDALLVVGDACSLPFRNEQFDAVTVGWGLRNVPDIHKAVSEAHRVLKRGGRFLTLDMARPKSGFIGKVSEFIFHHVVPFLGRLFGKTEAYTYLPKSTLQFLSRDEMTALFAQVGFSTIKQKDFFLGNICMHWGVKV